MTIDTSPRPAVRFDGAHCSIVIERPNRGVVVLRIAGHDVGEFGDRPMREIDGDLDAGPIELFVDARNVQGASLDVSSDWAQWLGKHRDRFRRVSMLTSTRFIRITADSSGASPVSATSCASTPIPPPSTTRSPPRPPANSRRAGAFFGRVCRRRRQPLKSQDGRQGE